MAKKILRRGPGERASRDENEQRAAQGLPPRWQIPKVPEAPQEPSRERRGPPEGVRTGPPPRRDRPPRREGAPERRRVLDPTTPPPEPIDPQRIATPAGLAELEAIAGMDFDMGTLLGQGSARLPAPGDLVDGRITRVTADGVHVDVGTRTEGWIPRKELPRAEVGDVVRAFVVALDDQGLLLSTRLSGEAASLFLEDAKERGVPVEGKVESRSSGGYGVRVGGVRAFCPRSQISRLPLADEDAVVGQTLSFLVIETGEKVVLSRRALEERELEEKSAQVRAGLSEGQVITATVISVQPWGVFLDHEGVELLLPRREASWEEIADLTTRFERGQRLTVRVLSLAADGGRITVTARDPSLDPWLSATTTLPSGKVVTGRVTSHTDFGAFVEVAPGLQGLLHRSRQPKLSPVGSSVVVRVLSVDPERRRIELAPQDFNPEAQAANVVGTEVTGEVIEVRDRGVVVRLADGRQGWLPQGEVELTPGTLLAQRFRPGHTVTARIVADDRERVTLSQRTVETEDWREALKQPSSGGMGTLGDLLAKARKK